MVIGASGRKRSQALLGPSSAGNGIWEEELEEKGLKKVGRVRKFVPRWMDEMGLRAGGACVRAYTAQEGHTSCRLLCHAL